MVVYMLSESVASRLRRHGFVGDVVEIYVRDGDLFIIELACKDTKKM